MTPFVVPPNNASTTLAAALSSSATSATLSSTLNFPSSIPSGYVLALTLNDAATRSVFEVVYVTAISGTTITITRGQEGTAAQAWAIGDYAYCAATNAVLAALGYGNSQGYANDTGTANAITVTLQPIPASIAAIEGVPIRVKIANTTTTSAPTIAINSLAVQTIVNPDGSSLGIGQLVAGSIATFMLDGTHAQVLSPAPFASALTNNGYAKLPGGLILQWGLANVTNAVITGNTFSFPIPFPNACLSITGSDGGNVATSSNSAMRIGISAESASTFAANAYNGTAWSTATVNWIAVGW